MKLVDFRRAYLVGGGIIEPGTIFELKDDLAEALMASNWEHGHDSLVEVFDEADEISTKAPSETLSAEHAEDAEDGDEQDLSLNPPFEDGHRPVYIEKLNKNGNRTGWYEPYEGGDSVRRDDLPEDAVILAAEDLDFED